MTEVPVDHLAQRGETRSSSLTRVTTTTITYRVRQFVRYAFPSDTSAIDAGIRARLTDPEWMLVSRLTAGDRAHLLRVRQQLEMEGCQDGDLLTAALLHDVGKADEYGRVWLGHRVLAVLLRRRWPGLLDRLSRPSASGIMRGFFLAAGHPQLGANMARKAGCTERVCWLIAHHDDLDAGSDDDLRWLMRVDRGN